MRYFILLSFNAYSVSAFRSGLATLIENRNFSRVMNGLTVASILSMFSQPVSGVIRKAEDKYYDWQDNKLNPNMVQVRNQNSPNLNNYYASRLPNQNNYATNPTVSYPNQNSNYGQSTYNSAQYQRYLTS